MIESLEDKRFALKCGGKDLVFITGTIQALPCEHVDQYRLETDNQIYDSKEYYFLAIQEDIDLYNISINDFFTFSVVGRSFNFQITNLTSDIDGWKKLTCSLYEVI